MDPLTHSLTGLAMSRAGLNRWCPRANAILVLAAMAPDIDLLSRLGGTEALFRFHRHITHALPGLPLVAALVVLVVQLLPGRKPPWKQAYVLATLGVASHLLLDWTTMYGMRVFVPFSAKWSSLDTTSLVDLVIWAVLILAAVAPLLSRLVSDEIGARSGTGRGLAVFALLFLVAYDCGRFVLHARAVAVIEARLYNGSPPARVAALPNPLNPLRWRGLVETASFYALADVDLLEEFDPAAARILYKADPNPAARRMPAFQAFLEFAQYPLWRFTPLDDPEGSVRVELMDLRFGAPPNPRFAVTTIIKPGG
ncbi:MAG: metal-dependent hydrolase [Acidobacteriota bacterium]